MTAVICLFVLIGVASLHSGPGLFDTVCRWFFFGFLVPVLIIVVLAEGGVIFDPRDEWIEQSCRNYELHFATYELCAEDAGRYYDANPDEFEE